MPKHNHVPHSHNHSTHRTVVVTGTPTAAVILQPAPAVVVTPAPVAVAVRHNPPFTPAHTLHQLSGGIHKKPHHRPHHVTHTRTMVGQGHGAPILTQFQQTAVVPPVAVVHPQPPAPGSVTHTQRFVKKH